MPVPDTPAPALGDAALSDAASDAAFIESIVAEVHREVDPRVQLCLRRHEGQLVLDLIQVLYPLRGRGLAEAAMGVILARADDAGWPVVLQPSPAFGADNGRLYAWYHRLGFRPEGASPGFGQVGWMARSVPRRRAA